MLPRSHMPASASASCLTTNLEGNRSGTHSDEEEGAQANALSEEAEKKLFLNFSVDLHEYFDNPKSEESVCFRVFFQAVALKKNLKN